MKNELSVFSLCLLLAVPNVGQENPKNWKDRAEYDLYNGASRAADTGERLRFLAEWERLYPSSEFMLERLRMFVQAHDAAGKAEEAFASAQRLVALSPSDLTALQALFRWGPRLKQASPDAVAVVRRTATELLAKLDEMLPDQRSRREMDSFFDSIDSGTPARTKHLPDAQHKEQRAKVERMAREALAWANDRQPR